MAPLQPSVLVVDDDDSIRLLIRTALRRKGYTVAEARDGREALHAMKTTSPGLVVLDLMMPLVSGWDVLRARAQDADLRAIPVIVVSAARNEAVTDEVKSSVSAFLPKPFDLEALETLVRSFAPAGSTAIA